MKSENDVPVPPRKPGLFNARQLRELDEADAVVLAARKPDHAAPLLEREITAQIVDELAQKAANVRQKLTQSKAQKGDSQTQTDLAHDTRETLILQIQEVQSAARQKFGPRSPLINSTYYGNTKLRQSRAILTQAVEGLLQTLETQSLPGITPAKIEAIRQSFAAYETALDNRDTGAGDAADDYTAALQSLEEVTRLRQQIQFAANAIWPAKDRANRETRRAFHMDPDKNFVG